MATGFNQALANLYRDETGATLVEYMLLVVLIGVAAIVGMTFLGKTANNRLNNITDAVK
jgi:Flp pilus assembly pilin Flp